MSCKPGEGLESPSVSQGTRFGTVAAMLASPRYEGPTIISISGAPDDSLGPLLRQRKRFDEMLVDLSAADWDRASRCQGWTVQDVVTHLVVVNAFWCGSILSGLAGSPTRILAEFDPALTPALMVAKMRDLKPREVLDRFVESNEAFLEVVGDLDGRAWLAVAESPAGHVPVGVVAHHALWDCWIHERDIALPIGLTPPTEPDEVTSCLRYVSAFTAALAIASGSSTARVFAVEADDPASRFVLEVGESVELRDDAAPPDAPCLRGDAVELVEALSIRGPLPRSAPTGWLDLREALANLFRDESSTGL